ISSRAFAQLGFILLLPCSAGYIEMGPRIIANKLFQESCRSDRSCSFPTKILNICYVALYHLCVIFIEGQWPEFLSSSLAGCGQLFKKLIVIAEQRSPQAAKRHYARS